MHNFHLPIGECTITLEDITCQLGLPIDGDVVTGATNMDWDVVCLNLLGAIPTNRHIVGQRIQMSWLNSTFQQLPDDATEIEIHHHAQAFILRMIGGWGFAVLACLYRGLCRAALISHQI
ncbi:hypothetical protein Lal_00039888 [Lupinus albus]|nr:hypothetical protein Lal_00039888 [Lupinus albus]